MLTDGEREQLRADLEATLPDECRVVRRAQGAFDAEDGTHDDSADAEIYEGPCRAVAWPGVTRRVVVGEQVEVLSSYWVTLPNAAVGLRTDDIVIITASADPDLVGREMVVRDIAQSSIAADRRLVCEDLAIEDQGGS